MLVSSFPSDCRHFNSEEINQDYFGNIFFFEYLINTYCSKTDSGSLQGFTSRLRSHYVHAVRWGHWFTLNTHPGLHPGRHFGKCFERGWEELGICNTNCALLVMTICIWDDCRESNNLGSSNYLVNTWIFICMFCILSSSWYGANLDPFPSILGSDSLVIYFVFAVNSDWLTVHYLNTAVSTDDIVILCNFIWICCDCCWLF